MISLTTEACVSPPPLHQKICRIDSHMHVHSGNNAYMAMQVHVNLAKKLFRIQLNVDQVFMVGNRLFHFYYSSLIFIYSV